MGQVLHGSATTTHAVRAAIQRSKASIQELSERYGINPKTVQKWRKRSSVEDAPMGPKERRSTVLSAEEEALVVAFRKHTLLPLDDCLYALQATIPHLTRSSLRRLFQRHDISRLPSVEGAGMALLERVGLADQARKLPADLSGGQQQRVAIARALAMQPRALLFDEPTSALDPESIKEVLDIMVELAHGGTTMVVVTHEMGFARHIAHRVVFMDRGRIVEAADPAHFFAAPASDRARAFLGQIRATAPA